MLKLQLFDLCLPTVVNNYITIKLNFKASFCHRIASQCGYSPRNRVNGVLSPKVHLSFRVLNRKLYKNELEQKWPRPDQSADWDMWMRLPSNRKNRECIIPDISRTYHFGAKGLNVGSFMQNIYFKRHALNNATNVKLDVDKMYKENYEKEIFRLIG